MNYKQIFFWTFFFISNIGLCQNNFKSGYLITLDNDTIHGLINLKSNYHNSKKCIFKKTKHQDQKTYTPKDIKAYRIENNKYYFSKEIELNNTKQQIFLEYLVNGIINLYYLKDTESEYFFIEKDNEINLLSNDLIYFEGENGVKYVKNSNQYKGVLSYLFYDSPDQQNNIATTSFAYNSLIKTTKDYHKSICDDFQCIDYTKPNKNYLFLEPFTGIINSWMGLNTSKDYAYDIKPYIGINLRIKPEKILNLWSVLIGLNYSTNNLEADYNNTLFTDYITTYRIYNNYSIIRVPIAIEYSMPFDKIQPFISLSYNNIFIPDPEYQVSKVIREKPYLRESNFRNYQYGVTASIGLKYQYKNSSYLFIKNEFEYRNPTVNLNHILDYNYVCSWSFNVGYGFNIKNSN